MSPGAAAPASDARATTEIPCSRFLRLKERMHDLDKPLRTVNEALWEEMSGYTEKEVRCALVFLGAAEVWLTHLPGTRLLSQLKSFGAKLKERNNVFRKASKVRSHQMKEALYSDLLQAQQVPAVCRPPAPPRRGRSRTFYVAFRRNSRA